MKEFLESLFSSSGFMPHGHCYLWTPGLVWLHVISDALIVLAYYSIPIALLYFVRNRTDIKFGWMFVCFAVFILACGTTHLMEIWNVWHSQYWLAGGIKALTALASVPTAILLARLVPAALTVPSPTMLARANAALKEEIENHRKARERVLELNARLEARVAERTGELHAANWELRRQITERQRAEEDLLASERRERERATELEILLEAVPTPVLIAQDPDCLHITGNRAADELLQVPRGAETSLSASDEKRPRHFKAFKDGRELRTDELPAQQAARGVSVENFEFSLVFDNGTIRHVLGYGTPLRDQEGRPRGAVHVLVDITEREQAEQALRKSEERFRRYFELGLIGMAITSPTKNWVEVNDEICRLLGYTRGELLRLTWEELTHPDDLPANVANFNRIMAGEIDSYSMDKRFIRKSGEVIDTTMSVTCLRLADGTVDCFLAMFQDITERKRSELALRESEHRYRHLIEALPAAVYTCDAEGRITLYNAAAAALWGRKPQLGKDQWCGSWKIYRPDGSLVANEDCLTAIALRDGRSVRGAELVIERPDGTRSHVLPHPDPIRDASGAIIGAVNMMLDVTERKRAEGALRESEARARQLLDSNIVGVVFWNLQGQILEANDLYLEMFGYTREDFRQGRLSCQKLTPPEYAEVSEKATRELIATGTCAPFEKECLRKDGSRFTVLARSALLQNQSQTGSSFVMDISERKSAEEALRESETRFRQLAENISEVFWLANPEGTEIHYLSPAYEKIWGRPCGSVYADPKSWIDAIHPDDRERVVEDERLQARHGEHDYTYRIIRPDGSVRWIRDREFPVRDETGKLIRVAGSAEDITERKDAEQQIKHYAELFQSLSRRLLEVQEEERRHLARELHDEIGQTLTAAKINLKIIAPQVPPAVAGRIKDSAQLLDRLLEQVRQLSLDLRPPLLDELGLVPALRWLAVQQAERARLRVAFTANVEDLDLDPPVRTACFRVAQEAITNAIRHAQAEKVAVELRAEQDRLCLVVQDDGVGFDKDAARQRAVRGASVGLVSMNERVSLLGGQFEVRSTPRQGTEIRAWFPLASRACRETRPSTEPA